MIFDFSPTWTRNSGATPCRGAQSLLSVSGIKHSVTEGKTAELSVDQTHKLIHSIKTSHVVGLRDRAVLGLLAYTGARVGPWRSCAD